MTNVPFDPRTLQPIGYINYGEDSVEVAKQIILHPEYTIKEAIEISFDDMEDYNNFEEVFHE